MIRGLSHAALSTPDLDRLLRFYCDLLGFERVSEFTWPQGTDGADIMTGLKNSAARCVTLKAGSAFLEVFEFSSPDPLPGDPERPLNNHGIAHLCVAVTGIDGEYERLRQAGVSFISEPVFGGEGVRCCYGRDPDGNVVELQEVSDPSHPMYEGD